MAELLVKAVSVVPYIEGAYRKGDIVEVRADGAGYGAKEGLPLFVVVKVPGLLMRQLKDYARGWDHDIQFAVVGSNLALDGHRIRIFVANASATGKGSVTRDQVEVFITIWGGTVFSVAPNEIVFDITVMDAFKSTGYWDIDVSQAIFTEKAYDQATGVHTVEIDYTALGNNPSYVETFLEGKVLEVISNTDRVATVTIDRATIRNEFQDDIARASSRMIERRRYYVDPAVVDTIAAGGGVYEATVGQLQIYLKDRWVE